MVMFNSYVKLPEGKPDVIKLEMAQTHLYDTIMVYPFAIWDTCPSSVAVVLVSSWIVYYFRPEQRRSKLFPATRFLHHDLW